MEICAVKGLFHLSNPDKLKWITLENNKGRVKMQPLSSDIYSEEAYMNITYGGENRKLPLQVRQLYSRPSTTYTSAEEGYR